VDGVVAQKITGSKLNFTNMKPYIAKNARGEGSIARHWRVLHLRLYRRADV
jgi:hypothetical protein